MCKEVSQTMDSLVEYLLFELRKRNLPTDEFRMQKLIFKIKMELGDEHELYPKLPFYWYLKGPYSEVVTESYEKKFPLINFFKSGIEKDYPEIIEISENIIKKRDYFVNQIDRDIYRQYAPYKFMYLYKYEIYDVAKKCETVDFDVEEFIHKLYVCESKLPNKGFYNEFNVKFSKFSTDVDLINDSGNFEKNWNQIKTTIIKIWKTFVKGLRINFKDKYYDNQLNQWKIEYEDDIIQLNAIINNISRYIDSNNLPNYIETESQKKIFDSTVGAYLKRG